MQDYCRTYPKQTQCAPVVIKEAAAQECQPFSVCLPFGRNLNYNGRCLSVEEPANQIPDGEYGIIVVENGCIVNALPNPVCEYTPPPCTPAAESCDTTGGSSGITLQPNACNLLTVDAAGRYGVYPSITGGDNVTVSGCGSQQNPFVISVGVDVDTTVYMQSASDQQIVLSGNGTVANPFVIGLAESGVTAGTYAGFSVDRYGRITDYNNTETKVTSIVAGPGMSVTEQSGIATVSLAESGVESGDYQFGGYTVTVDLAGRATALRQSIDLDEDQTIDPYDVQLGINTLGSVTSITPYVRPAANMQVAHNGANSESQCQITTDRQGRLCAEWHGYEAIWTSSSDTSSGTATEAPISDDQLELYINNSTYITGAITGGDVGQAQGFGNVLCRFIKKERTVQSESGSGSQTRTVEEIALVEWRGISMNTYAPGTYTVAISRVAVGDTTPPLTTASVLSVQLIN